MFDVNDNEFMNDLITEIVNIFKLENVERVRLLGLARYVAKADYPIPIERLELIIDRLIKRNIIICTSKNQCPFCNDIIYHVIDLSNVTEMICDTCNKSYGLRINKREYK